MRLWSVRFRDPRTRENEREQGGGGATYCHLARRHTGHGSNRCGIVSDSIFSPLGMGRTHRYRHGHHVHSDHSVPPDPVSFTIKDAVSSSKVVVIKVASVDWGGRGGARRETGESTWGTCVSFGPQFPEGAAYTALPFCRNLHGADHHGAGPAHCDHHVWPSRVMSVSRRVGLFHANLILLNNLVQGTVHGDASLEAGQGQDRMN